MSKKMQESIKKSARRKRKRAGNRRVLSSLGKMYPKGRPRPKNKKSMTMAQALAKIAKERKDKNKIRIPGSGGYLAGG